jgi:hypothetical protein
MSLVHEIEKSKQTYNQNNEHSSMNNDQRGSFVTLQIHGRCWNISTQEGTRTVIPPRAILAHTDLVIPIFTSLDMSHSYRLRCDFIISYRLFSASASPISIPGPHLILIYQWIGYSTWTYHLDTGEELSSTGTTIMKHALDW